MRMLESYTSAMRELEREQTGQSKSINDGDLFIHRAEL